MKLSSLETHVIAGISVVGAAITAIHPGFHLPTDTATIVSSLFVTAAGVVEATHQFFKSSTAAKIATVEALGQKAVAATTAPVVALPADHTLTITATPPAAPPVA